MIEESYTIDIYSMQNIKNGVILVRYIDMVNNDLNEEFIVSNGFAYELYEKILG